MNQIELEQEMIDGGRAKMFGSFNRNEEQGAAHNNPYAAAVYRRFVQPLADQIDAYCGEVKRGVMAAGKALLRPHDPMVLAFMTVRMVMDTTLQSKDNAPTAVARALGQSIYGETLLAKFEQVEPDLYFTLVNDFERRMTKSERHRLTVFKMQAEKNGVPLPVWSPEDKLAIGTILLYLARDVGLVEITEVRKGKKTVREYNMTPDVAGMLDNIKDFVAGASPMVLPCVVPPVPWTDANNGGYHTPGMRRISPCCIRGRPRVEDLTDVPDIPLRALNILQSRPWRINRMVLDAVDLVGQRFDVGEVLAQAELPKPKSLLWLDDVPKEEMNPAQLAEFGAWKIEMREWYTENKSRGVQWGRYYEALRVARKFKDLPFWFVYQYDYRGRAYANTRGVSPQGSDLQKALLMADVGVPIADERAKFWFYTAGANRFGYDKATLAERYEWTVERSEMICAIAADPVANRQWTEADNPFQFLAWCFEFAQYTAMPESFLSRLALGQDGSCNGLQHFSAMLRDEVGGLATNLVPSTTQQDIYRLVAVETTRLLQAMPHENCEFTLKWKLHSLSRDLVKRSVMTLPYGSTRFSCADFIYTEYMAKHKAPEFAKGDYQKAARWLSVPVWDAIGNVVVKAREAMAWLQNASDELIDAGIDEIYWRSPSGFMVRQRYGKEEFVLVKTRLAGGVRIRPTIKLELEEPCKRRHRNGIAPNFVHSHDAAHMHLLICAAEDHGLGHLAFIHDDYGTTADGTETLHKLIRATFVAMYEQGCPLTAFRDTYGITEDLPERGDLDLNLVHDSTYFFA
ncbi:RNA polymerase [Pseudomonas phage VSW-3]|uniref:DNA-directed RNA polymerase n=1 Tax=Pseudomonas phage VSW-3 TaxID=1852562 RepID=A0A173GCK9_9CAUD|nr:RNA polymerase [Pseudomonas phage VSW-3]ANH51091.1 RNA polymerase [Pseudomonas phage VSW-3]